MSMEHKAFVFDFNGFDAELRPTLEDALLRQDPTALVAFISEHAASLADPYEGEPLAHDWKQVLERADVQEYGDFALTKFYRPAEDVGLGQGWEEAQRLLLDRTGRAMAVLGRSVGSPTAVFDPGRMGAYFQSEEDVRTHLAEVGGITEDRPVLSRLRRMLEAAAQKKRGLYVTF